jgi:hypothetical protein
VEDRRPERAGGEVVEHDDPALVDQVGDGVDADRAGVAGVEVEQRERALVGERGPVGGQDLDLGIVLEDLRRRPGQLRVELRGQDPRFAAYART